jgi:carboxyl-terminal processing protease
LIRVVRYSLLAIGLLLLIGLSFSAGFGLGRLDVPPSQAPAEFKIFWEAWNLAQEHFVDQKALEPLKMTRGAIKGMLASLGDPHTGYVDPQHYQFEQSDLQGSFSGIGAHVGIQNRQLTVIAPIEGSPAEKAGIRAGDKILAVDGASTSAMSLGEAVSKIRGPAGSKVVLTILHPEARRPVDIEIIRAEIQLPSVSSRQLPDDISYLRIAFFSERTNEEAVSKLQEILKRHPRGLILDLRNDPGGLLDETIDLASQFLEGGTVVAYQVDRDGKETPFVAKGGGLATDIPLVVLVNKGSASASEILAGALQDAGRAVLIGEETFGKGAVNRFYPLSDGSAVYITFARWVTPKRRQIEGKGLLPDIEVPLTEEDIKAGRDPQLDRAIEYLKTGR